MFMIQENAHPYGPRLLRFSYQRISRRRWPLPRAIMSLVCSLVLANSVQAEFTTIINSPPTELNYYGTFDSNTQVNLFPGGVLPARHNIGPRWSSVDNIEINLLGGTIGSEQDSYLALNTSSDWSRATNVTVNLIDGTVWGDVQGNAAALITLSNATVKGGLSVRDGSLAVITGGEIVRGLAVSDGGMVRLSGGKVNTDPWGYYKGVVIYGNSVFLMSGGVVGGSVAIDDSYASLTGGRIEGEVYVSTNGLLEVAGGTLGRIGANRGGAVSLAGDEFLLDGMPMEGLSANSQNFDFPVNSVLTGVLADGTPVTLANTGSMQDSFADNQITLRLEPVPASEPRHFEAPGDVMPAGLRTGQSISLHPGAIAPANFSALAGSAISIEGGAIDRGFEASGASVTLTAGSIGEQATIYRGTTLQVLDGEIGSNFEAAAGSRLEMKGGTIGAMFDAHAESEVIYAGGKMAGWLYAREGSSFTVAGGEFKINGVPIAALATPGAAQQIELPEFGVLSGTLSDGTAFAFGSGDQWFAPGSLTLQASDVPTAGPALIRLPSDPVPQGLRSGQTLLLADGGDVGDNFTADWGSIVRMSGGRIGQRFQAVGSFVNVTGGEIESINALLGSVVNINGGSVNYHVTARRGAIVNLSAGEIAGGMYAYDGGRVNVSGGTLGGYVYIHDQSSISISGGTVTDDITLYDNSLLTIDGGEFFGGISTYRGSQVTIRGGRLGDDLFVGEEGRAILSGSDFRIDGEPLGGDDPLGWYGTLNLPAKAVLSGVFTDGTPFAFTSSEGDWFAPGTLEVTSSLLSQLPRNIGWPLFPKELPAGLLPGETLTLETGEHVGANFTAGWDSTLTIAGGEIGENFEAVGAQVNLLAGSIGNSMDALFGTEFNVLGGTVGHSFQAHRGSVVNIFGGTVSEVTARSGSTINITGGTLGRYVDGDFASGGISLEAGSALHITGTYFLLDGVPIEGLEPGSSIVLEWDRPLNFSSLHARLLDGTPFYAYLSDYAGSIPDDWQFTGSRSITLTAALASSQVPEPSCLALVISVLVCCTRRLPKAM